MAKNLRLKLWWLIFAVLVIPGYSEALALQLPRWFPFKGKDALKEWEEKIFKGKGLYSIIVHNTDGYLSAYSQNSSSGIFYKLNFDPKKYPKVSWKWKVLKFPDKSKRVTDDKGWIEKDDYAARFYIIFPKLALNLSKALEYIWDEELPEGTIITSPYFKNIKLIVAESGKENLGNWVYEERNVYEDFKRAFGREPEEVGAIAIMTDTDNTSSTAEADYDEIKVGYKNGGK